MGGINLVSQIVDSINYHRIYRNYRKNGYSKNICDAYIKELKVDTEKHLAFPADLRRKYHRWGFFIPTAEKLFITEKNRKKHISDIQRMYLKPVNNTFGKWFKERLTPYVVLQPFHEDLPRLYAEVLYKNGKQYIIPKHDMPDEMSFNCMADTIALLKREKELYVSYVGIIATVVNRRTRRTAFLLKYDDADDKFFIGKEESTEEDIIRRLESLKFSFLIQENYMQGKTVGTTKYKKKRVNVDIDFLSLFVGNRSCDDVNVLDAYAKVYLGRRRKPELVQVRSLKEGIFFYRGKKFVIPRWDEIVEKVIKLGTYVSEVQLLKIGVSYKDERILFPYISSEPQISKKFEENKKLRRFYKQLLSDRRYNEKNRSKASIKSSREFKRWEKIQIHLVKKGKLRKGIRTYMFILWKNSIIDDLLHTKGYSLKQKIWAWKRGFLSFRIHQYGLTEDNYSKYLSELEYHWLNRINNYTQKWINDKTTFRYALEPFKKHLPEYYFLVMRRGKNICVKSMMDAPEGTPCTIQAIIDLLREKKEFAFKPSAGTHGDGFYKLVFEENQFFINGELATEEDVIHVLTSQKSFYVVTDYLYLAEELKQIYPASLNTIRVMVVNKDVHEPKIMHAYMRIGASSSGFTDNIAYGGIAAKIDLDTGYFHDGETLVDHVYYPCEVHPDTGVPVCGYVPHWEEIKEGLIEICKTYGELEYLGFDVAVTEDSFKLLEINIHQDLHKVGDQSEEVRAYFNQKLKEKQIQVYGSI